MTKAKTNHYQFCAVFIAVTVLALLTSSLAHADYIYVSCKDSGTIEKFDSSGNRYTFASGLDTPTGLAFDKSGNLYVANVVNEVPGSGTIEKFDSSGNRSTFASGLSYLNGVGYLAFDSSGNLYVAEHFLIEKFDSRGNNRSTFAEGLGFQGLAFDSSGNLYTWGWYWGEGAIPPGPFGAIYKFDSSGNKSIFSGYDLCNTFYDLAFDSSGNLYVTDEWYGNVYKFNSSGQWSLFASGLNHLSLHGLAFDSSGNLYVANKSTNTIEKFDSSGNRTTFASGLSGPWGIAVQVPEPTITGSIVGWGNNEYGQATPPAGNNFIAIAGGYEHSLALKSDGSIVGWGNNSNGQATPPDGNGFIAIAAGGGNNPSFGLGHSLALKSDGSIVGWGFNWIYGQATPPAGNNFIAIAAGALHSLALKSDGSIIAWGDNWYGEATPPAGNDFTAIAASGPHSLALKSDGSIVGWGYNGSGEATPPAGNNFIAIAAGVYHSLALYVPPVIAVTIDIKPGNVPVAILSSATFDATTVDRSTVEFAGAHPLPNYCSQLGEIPEDVDGDGLLDIVFYFKTSDLNLPPGDMEACLTGRTFSGQEFRGCGSVLRLGPVAGDLDGKGEVDFKDFAVFASHWLECTDPNCR